MTGFNSQVKPLNSKSNKMPPHTVAAGGDASAPGPRSLSDPTLTVAPDRLFYKLDAGTRQRSNSFPSIRDAQLRKFSTQHFQSRPMEFEPSRCPFCGHDEPKLIGYWYCYQSWPQQAMCTFCAREWKVKEAPPEQDDFNWCDRCGRNAKLLDPGRDGLQWERLTPWIWDPAMQESICKFCALPEFNAVMWRGQGCLPEHGSGLGGPPPRANGA